MADQKDDPRTGKGVPQPPTGTPHSAPGGLGTGTPNSPEKEPAAQPGKADQGKH
jgi:hypothetical protein